MEEKTFILLCKGNKKTMQCHCIVFLLSIMYLTFVFEQAEVGQTLLFRTSCYAIELLSILQGYFSIFFACIPIFRNSLRNSLR